MGGKAKIEIPHERIAHFCRKHHIRKLSFFGSVISEHFTQDSDVDVLVEFDPNHIPGFFRFARMQRELAEILGRKVDLRTPQELSKYFRSKVLAEAEVQYAER